MVGYIDFNIVGKLLCKNKDKNIYDCISTLYGLTYGHYIDPIKIYEESGKLDKLDKGESNSHFNYWLNDKCINLIIILFDDVKKTTRFIQHGLHDKYEVVWFIGINMSNNNETYVLWHNWSTRYDSIRLEVVQYLLSYLKESKMCELLINFIISGPFTKLWIYTHENKLSDSTKDYDNPVKDYNIHFIDNNTRKLQYFIVKSRSAIIQQYISP